MDVHPQIRAEIARQKHAELVAAAQASRAAAAVRFEGRVARRGALVAFRPRSLAPRGVLGGIRVEQPIACAHRSD